jgi:ribonucleotide reductase alpha subunit
MKLPDLSIDIWTNNYCGPNETTLQDTWHRQAFTCSSIEEERIRQRVYEDYMWLLSDFNGAAGGRITANVGIADRLATTLYNCFVHCPADINYKDPDSINGIYDMLKAQAQTLKSEGGYGTNFSWVRPEGSYVKGIGGRTPGVLKFMELWDKSSEIITAGSEEHLDDRKLEEKKKIRKGAQMGVLCIWHPEIESFIDAKLVANRLTKFNLSVGITRGFIHAVLNNLTWDLKFPDTTCKEYKTEWFGDIYDWEDKKYPTIIHKTVKAADLWEKIMKASYTRNEPGVLFLDIANELNTLSYVENIQASNPCFSGDTLIAVADGRNAVAIKQLAEEGKDIPVYSLNKDGMVEIKIGRNPRVTGYNNKLIRVHLDDGSYLDVTPDHNFILMDGSKKRAEELLSGDSLPRFTKDLEPVKKGSKDYYRVTCNTKDSSIDRLYEHRLIAKFYKQDEWDLLYNTAKRNGFSNTGGIVIHHEDYNSLNNSPNNLRIMTFMDHSKMHVEIDQCGENNGRYSGFTKEEIKEKALWLTKSLNRRFSTSEWISFAKENGLPQGFSKFRKEQFGSILELSKLCALELSLEYIDSDPRAVTTYFNMLSQGYDAKIENNVVLVKKICEICKEEFYIEHFKREQAVCSIQCSNTYLSSNKMKGIKSDQARIYSELKFKLNKAPTKKEWEFRCKEESISYVTHNASKFGFKNFKEVANAGNSYNHKVTKIEELPDNHTVYNITVDDNHTVAIITKINSKRNNNWFSGIFTPQCGEILMGTGICNLFSLNLVKYVKLVNDNYEFDYDKFKKAVKIAVRFSDSINDISRLPIDDYKNAVQDKRRIGIGVLALGSLHYILGIKFSSPESLELIDNIFKTKCETELLASAELGKEKGSFRLFDKEKYFSSNWWKTLPISDSVKTEVEQIGEMRNSHHAANAPTGNMALYVGAVSGGIEPVFLKEYIRWVSVPDLDKIKLRNNNFNFPDVSKGEWFETEYLKHSKSGTEDILLGTFNNVEYQVDKNRGLTKSNLVEDYGWRFVKENFSKEKIDDLNKKGVFVTTDELSVDEHVNPLKVIAKYVNMNSSKTVNLRNDYPYESFKKLYLDAWKSKIKGITSYRAGTMTAVLEKVGTNHNDRPNVIIDSYAPKRLAELPCDIKKVKIQNEVWTIVVGLLNNKPYEIFGGLSKYIDVANKYKTGKIIKKGKNNNGDAIYNLIVNDSDGGVVVIISDIANVFENKNYGDFTRILSLSLRHGTPIQYVVEQLQKNKSSDMTSFSKVMARVLKSYIKDGTKSMSDKYCHECKSVDSIIYQEGCILCKNCGFTKCS